MHFSITDCQFTDSGPRHADGLVCLVHLTGRVCSFPYPRSVATAVIDGEHADGEVRWYDHSRLNYAGASMSDVGWSDVTTGSLPFVTAMVLDPANKTIFQTTSRRQHMITCSAHCCCQAGHHRQQQQHRRRPSKPAKAYVKTCVLLLLKFDVTAV